MQASNVALLLFLTTSLLARVAVASARKVDYKLCNRPFYLSAHFFVEIERQHLLFIAQFALNFVCIKYYYR